jgi:succinylglutamate desuccinylase
MIHGVEVAGLAVLVELLELVTRGELIVDVPVGVALGNIKAALAGVRFVERDLNRSFGRDQAALLEEKRADELERLFTRSARLLDIHQVKLKIDRPFWIFPYTKNGFKFARSVAPEVSVITHWGRGFSQDGQCSDEWVNGRGGAGVTIELGQNGFDPKQIEHGVRVCSRAISLSTSGAVGNPLPNLDSAQAAPIYTWGEIIPYPKTGQPVLNPGWHNFRVVKKGEVLGVFDGSEIKASVSGPVLFPKYPDPRPDGTYGETPPAAELIRILREISEDELPK